MSAQRPRSPRPDDTPGHDPGPATSEAATDAAEAAEAETPEPAEPVGQTRRERRAAARGGAAAKVAGPAIGRRPPVPAKHRDYASRRRG